MNGKSRAWALALLIAVFLVGGAAGAAVDRLLVGDRQESTDRRSRSEGEHDRRRSYLDWLAAELELSEDQRTEVHAILVRSREQASELWHEYRPRYQELQERARAEIRGLLSEEQVAAYDALLQRQRQRRERDEDRGRDNTKEERK